MNHVILIESLVESSDENFTIYFDLAAESHHDHDNADQSSHIDAESFLYLS